MSVAPSRSISATFIEPSGNTGDCEKVTTPDDDIAIASASPVESYRAIIRYSCNSCSS